MKPFALLALALTLVGYWHHPVSCQNQDANKPDEKIYDGKEVDHKASVLSKPEAGYTEEARQKNVVGVVELTAVFAASGEVKNIEVRKALQRHAVCCRSA